MFLNSRELLSRRVHIKNKYVQSKVILFTKYKKFIYLIKTLLLIVNNIEDLSYFLV